MGLRFIDSFDHYTTVLQKWTSIAGAGNGISAPLIQAATGRAGSQSLKYQGGGGGGVGFNSISKTVPGAALSSLIVGFAWKTTDISEHQIMHLMEDGVCHLALAMNDFTGRLEVFLGSVSGALLGTSDRVCVADTYYFIELKATIHETTGSFELRINETVEVSASGIDTRNGGVSGNVNILKFGGIVQTSELGYMNVDDVYLTDSGTFLGDCRVEAIRPEADGAHIAWTPSTGGTHFDDVDDTVPNEDTDYITSTGVGTRDSWTYTDIAPTGATIRGIQYMPRARTDIEGARVIKPFYRVSAVDYDFATGLALTTSYEYPAGFCADVNPSTGSAWTLTQIQAAEFGIKVEA